MPPTLMNGKICYIEMPATDIARSSDLTHPGDIIYASAGDDRTLS
jgi:hypothetical protein